MHRALIHHTESFPMGYTAITEMGEAQFDTGIRFGILKVPAHTRTKVFEPLETAYLLMQGVCQWEYGSVKRKIQRRSLFDEEPCAIHFSAGETLFFQTETECEFAVIQVENDRKFKTEIFDEHSMLESEHRAKGILNNTCYRNVRTLFDPRNRPEANLVLGEVINFPGGWSSYPPHHHVQPEIYHYRFTEPQGYGHGELGEDVFKVRHRSTLKILDSQVHAQTAAPGYGMYYIWMIRNLPEKPYQTPIFEEAHAWILSKEVNQRVWQPKFLSRSIACLD